MNLSKKSGITVTSIVVYVILFFMFTTITTIISSRFNENLFNDRGMAINVTAINKLQYNLLNSANDSFLVEGNIKNNVTTLTFSNGDVYTFDSDNSRVLKNNGVLIKYLKDYDIKLIDDIVILDITLNKYTNEITRNIKIKVPTKEYVSTGLIAHFDGIDNVGYKMHDGNAYIWQDLSNNAITGTLSSTFTHDKTTNGWLENGILMPLSSASKYSVNALYSAVLPTITFEINLNIQDVYLHSPTYNDYVYYFGIYDAESGGNRALRLAFRYGVTLAYDSVAAGSNTGAVFEYKSTTLSEFYNHTVTVVQSDLTTRTLYIDGNKIKSVTNKTYIDIVMKRMILRSWTSSGYIAHSIRVYDRALTAEEIQRNYMIDRLRFGEK